ncbi:hypothetical protein MJ561_11445 [Klebsiella pneumoniae]|nr:hypothetical protein MJ561_11445 [Klebsiella pneumoniae]
MAFLLRPDYCSAGYGRGAALGVAASMPRWSLGTMPFRLMRLLAVDIAGVVALFRHAAGAGLPREEFVRRT